MILFKNGIDVSYYDGGGTSDANGKPIPRLETIDWFLHAAEGWGYTFIKVSQADFKDPLFTKQWNAAKGHIYRSGYHFFKPSADITRSVNKTIEFFDGDLGELPLLFDLEADDGRSDVPERAFAWMELWERETSTRPIVYSSKGFLDKIKAYKYSAFSKYMLHMAQYPYDNMSEPARSEKINRILEGLDPLIMPNIYSPFKRMPFIQWTAKGSPLDVAGYYIGSGKKEAVDFNVYNNIWGGVDERAFMEEFKLGGLPPDTDTDTGTGTGEPEMPDNTGKDFGKVRATVSKLNIRDSMPGGTYMDIGDLFSGYSMYGKAANGWIEFDGYSRPDGTYVVLHGFAAIYNPSNSSEIWIDITPGEGTGTTPPPTGGIEYPNTITGQEVWKDEADNIVATYAVVKTKQ